MFVNHDLQLKVRFWYKISNYITISGVRTILRHLHRCPKLGHGREHDLGHILVLRHFREHGPSLIIHQ